MQNCYEHHKTDKDDKEKDEPNWVEVVVELMLSLLSRESYLLRQLISRVFSHLCSELTPQASHQILQVCCTRTSLCFHINKLYANIL